MDRAERLNKQNKVAKRLIISTYKCMMPELERRAKETHKNELKEWGVELNGVEEAEDVVLYMFSYFLLVIPHWYHSTVHATPSSPLSTHSSSSSGITWDVMSPFLPPPQILQVVNHTSLRTSDILSLS